MKTSNKILWGALAAYLLFTVVDTVGYVREYDAVREAATDLIKQLEQTPIHTLVTTGDKPFGASTGSSPKKFVLSREPFDPNGIRISNDTLYIADPRGYVGLPHLKTHVRNGVPIPLD